MEDILTGCFWGVIIKLIDYKQAPQSNLAVLFHSPKEV